MKGLYRDSCVVIIAVGKFEDLPHIEMDMSDLDINTPDAVRGIGRWEGKNEHICLKIVQEVSEDDVIFLLQKYHQQCALVSGRGTVYTLDCEGVKTLLGERLARTSQFTDLRPLDLHSPMLDTLPANCTVIAGGVYEAR